MKKILNFHQNMKRTFAILTAVLLFIQAPLSMAAFSDVPNTDPNYVAVSFLQEQGVIGGYEDGTYKPGQLINRAEALKIILEGAGTDVPLTVEESPFTDVAVTDWFARYVMGAQNIGIVGGNPDGSFAPGRNVNRAEFIKMILEANQFKKEKWSGLNIYPDVPETAWFASYMNYAGQAGLVIADSSGNLNPGVEINRGEVAEIMYIMKVILNGTNTQFLISQAEMQMVQIDVYIGVNNPVSAKRAAELSVDMTQQAYKNLPEDNVVLGAAKLARAYDYLVNAYMAGISQSYTEAREWADKAIAKADEAWEANNETQPLARHIKDKANEIISQIPA